MQQEDRIIGIPSRILVRGAQSYIVQFELR